MYNYKEIVRQLKAKYGFDYINRCNSVEMFYLNQARDMELNTPNCDTEDIYF